MNYSLRIKELEIEIKWHIRNKYYGSEYHKMLRELYDLKKIIEETNEVSEDCGDFNIFQRTSNQLNSINSIIKCVEDAEGEK